MRGMSDCSFTRNPERKHHVRINHRCRDVHMRKSDFHEHLGYDVFRHGKTTVLDRKHLLVREALVAGLVSRD